MSILRWAMVMWAGVLAGDVLAWGPEGHRVVAHIAELRLTEEARRELARLLPSDQQISDGMICNWPDYIRKDRPETAPWHYVDIPIGAASYDADTVCPTGQCVVGQVEAMAARLADRSLTVEQRMEALRFLVHFTGDLHQPLHCADNADDRGGNERPVLFPGEEKPTNLHAVWDYSLPKSAMKSLGSLEYGDKLKASVSRRQEKRWSKGNPEAWAWESHGLAIKYAYSIVPNKEGPPVEIDSAYIRKGRRVVERQLMKAGVRLSVILNECLKPVDEADAVDAAHEVRTGES